MIPTALDGLHAIYLNSDIVVYLPSFLDPPYVIVEHPDRRDTTAKCRGIVYLQPSHRDDAYWHMESLYPLSIQPLLRCMHCQAEGAIVNGYWLPIKETPYELISTCKP